MPNAMAWNEYYLLKSRPRRARSVVARLLGSHLTMPDAMAWSECRPLRPRPRRVRAISGQFHPLCNAGMY